MSDTLTNALAQAGRSSSVLAGIQNPAVVNPLAGMGSAISAVSGMQGLAEKAAQQAAGQAYQGAIDQQTGEFDPNKFRTLLAQSGPAAMAAGAALLNTQQISSNQLQQNLEKAKWVNSTSGALLQSGDFSDAAMLGALHKGVAGGILTLPEAQRQLATMPPDAAGRQRWLQEHQDTAASFAEQMQQRFGTRENIVAPQGTYNTPIPPARAGAPTIVTPHGATPGATTSTTEPYDDQGIIPRDANGNPTRTPKGYTSVTKPVTAVPGVPTGGPPQYMPQGGGGTSGSTPPPIPPLPGQKLVLRNGQFVPATPPTTPLPQTPATPPPTTTKPPAITAPPQGQPEKLKADVEAYTRDQAAQPDVQTRAQNMAHAYDALQQLQSATGKGAEGINNLRSYMQTLGILPSGAVTEQKLFEIMHKYTERAMIDAAGGSSTDLGRRMSEQANAGTLLSTPANLEILRNDMGKTLQTIAAYKDHSDKTGTGYLESRAKVADSTDPRGFMWNMYSPEEQAKINAEVDKDPVAAGKLHKAIGMSQRLQLQIPGLTTPPVRQKQSFVIPPASAANALQMTG